MFTKFFVAKLMITALIIVHVTCIGDDELKILIETADNEAMFFKPPQCILKGHWNCLQLVVQNYSGYHIPGRWYYSAYLKSCLYLPIELTSESCPGKDHVLRTRKECEDLCGEPCIVIHGNYKTESGICTMDCPLRVPYDVQLNCKKGHSFCCPRGYRTQPFVPNSPTTENPITTSLVQAVIKKETRHQNYNSTFSANVTAH